MTHAGTRAALLAALGAAACAWAAQPPAPAATASPPPAAQPGTPVQPAPAPTLGRLFFTAAERARLDEMRKRPVVAPPPEAVPPPPLPEYVTLNGVVRRSDGTATVWLNEKPVQGQRSAEGLVIAPVRAGAPANVTVRLPETGRSVELKVGQQLEVTSGQVQERYRAPAPSAPSRPAAAPAAESRGAERTGPPRRASRDRELLRELLRDIDAPASAEPAREAAAAPGDPAR